MPSLFDLTNAAPQQDAGLPVEQPYRGANLGPLQGDTSGVIGNTPVAVAPAPQPEVVQALDRPEPDGVGTIGKIINKLTGSNGEERYQLWPEKVVREALAAPHDAVTGAMPQYAVDPVTGDVHTSPQMIEGAQAVSALAGSGGLAGTTDATLGATPFLRPALKYGDKIYKAPTGGQHLDALPAHLAEDFQTKAMNGEDINHYNFGFMNHKGQFLDREKALDYAVKEGLVDPHAGQYGVLTSTLLADSSKPGTAIEAMAKTGSPFYSALEHNVNQIGQAKMTGDQWLGTLANKPGVKPEEMDWTGVKDFLKERGNQPVSKAELQEHLQNNKVELKEVQKGTGELKAAAEGLQKEAGSGAMVNGHKLYPDEIEQGLWDGSLTPKDLPTNLQPHAEKMLSLRHQQESPTKYHSYQLPGGENYREMLMTLPMREKAKLEQHKVIRQDGHVDSTYNNAEGAATRAQAIGGTVRQADTLDINGPNNYRSSHWDEPNILAHVRMNDRTIDGKKSLHLEEIQSDWGQAGRENGFKSDAAKASTKLKELIKEASTLSTKDERYKEIYKELPALQAKANAPVVPDMPFKKTWHELAIKRMLREASEKGYERLSWTSGEHHPTNPKNLKQTGPEADRADKGMQGFYNDILPKAVEKIGKEYGVKVKTHELETNPKGWKITPPTETASGKWMVKSNDYNSKGFHFDTKEEAEANLAQNIAGERATKKIHYIDIPPKLRDAAMSKGFPLFAGGYMYTPVAGNPFADKK